MNDIERIISATFMSYPSNSMIKKVAGIVKEPPVSLRSITKSLGKTLESVIAEQKRFEKSEREIIKNIKSSDSQMYRLPENVIPTHYNLHLRPFIDNFTFYGEVEIMANISANTNEIVIHVEKLKMKKVSVKLVDGKNNTDLKSNLEFDEKHNFMKIKTGQIKKGSFVRISANYEGIINNEMKGFYRSSYKINGTTR